MASVRAGKNSCREHLHHVYFKRHVFVNSFELAAALALTARRGQVLCPQQSPGFVDALGLLLPHHLAVAFKGH